MPPKRTSGSDHTQRWTKRRCSSRLNNSSLIGNADTTNVSVQSEQTRRPKKASTNKSVNSPNVTNLDSMIDRSEFLSIRSRSSL